VGAELTDSEIRRPVRIRPGDTVAVVAPSGVVAPERLAAGIRVVQGLGLQVVAGDAVLERHAYLAGPDERRRADLQRMLDDPAIRAIFCARGGFGSQRIVPSLDLRGLARDPKPVIGFSDVTALLSALVGAGVRAFHGPMVAADLAQGLSARSRHHFVRLLMDPEYRWTIEVPVAIRPGCARGPLVGGCLSVVASLLGTPWSPRLDGSILFLEDIDEWPYRLDRLLTQLRQAGVFARVAGVVFGAMTACRSSHDIEPTDVVRARLKAGLHGGLDAIVVSGGVSVGPYDVVRAAFADAPFPVGVGLPAGHDRAERDLENLALPLGARVELDCDRGRLAALEPAVR
jgi:muramoyltetrapeptide carboxypeptidase